MLLGSVTPLMVIWGIRGIRGIWGIRGTRGIRGILALKGHKKAGEVILELLWGISGMRGVWGIRGTRGILVQEGHKGGDNCPSISKYQFSYLSTRS